MDKLLIEIGTEEIPAGYIEPAMKAFSDTILKKLDKARIQHGASRYYATPRRLALEVSDVAGMQETVTTEVMGPPEKVAYDAAGKPTVAALKFAEKVGLPLEKITIRETDKGKYLCARIREEGKDSVQILSGIIPDAIRSIPFPKTMKWSDLHFFFARPVHYFLALLGKRVIPFSIETIESGNRISGHRFHSSEPIVIESPDEYVEKLRAEFVIVDIEERKKAVAAGITKAAENVGGKILDDPELLDIVNNLIEYPAPVIGKFEDEFLELPDEVLITAMREHQKYFAVVDASGKLMPCFVAVNNTRAKDMNLVATGHERVIRARLSDAKFFYRVDLESSFDTWVEKLNGVLFQAKLGTMNEKVQRVKTLAEWIADQVDPGSGLKENASRAAWLCKADLVTQVVGEFPKLQGIMGRVYAGVKNEPDEVAAAIEEHYRPVQSGGTLPETVTGAVTAIADKIDSICGCFSVGLIPTGASDPYALRRQGIGIIQIMLDKGFTFSLGSLIQNSVRLFSDKVEGEPEDVADTVLQFFRNRITHILAEEGFSKDIIAAVVDVSVDHVPYIWNRVDALERMKKEPDFETLAIAFKRAVNIIKKADPEDVADSVDQALFEDACESELYKAVRDISGTVSDHLENGRFQEALLAIASIRPAVDAFFDGVMVMSDDRNIRGNRLALLEQVAGLFGSFADFSKIQT